MTQELWFGIGHYLLSVLIIFCLLVALMEASRKYDRFREPAYLFQAIGYFLLSIWALLQAISLQPGILLAISVVSQILGLLFLAAGFYIYHHFHPLAEDDDSAAKAKPGFVLKLSKKHQDLMALLSANSVEPTTALSDESEDSLSSKDALDTTEADKITDISEAPAETDTVQTSVEDIPSEQLSAPSESVDLSYLVSRRKLKKSKKEKAIKNSAPGTTESRSELMDDLFPLNHPSTGVPDEPTHLPGEISPDAADAASTTPMAKQKVKQTLANKTAKPSKTSIKKSNSEPAPAILLLGGLTNVDWLALWPEFSIIFPLLIILVILIPQHHERGRGFLIGGFVTVLVATILSLFWAPATLGPYLTSDTVGLSALALKVLSVVGYGLVAVAGWLKIKGKVTHHFLRIVSLVYIVLSALTVGLAIVMVKDQTTLQLLLILITGVLMTILPIIHSLTYSHPHQPTEGSEQV